MDATERIAHTVRVASIYVPPDKKDIWILLVREKPKKSRGAKYIWTLPGGAHETKKDGKPKKNGNSIKRAAARENREETGIEINPETLSEKLGCVIQGGDLGLPFTSHEVHVFLWVTNRKTKPSPQDDDILDARWFRLQKLPSEAFLVDGAPLASSTWPQLRKLFEDKSCQQLLTAASIGEKRINGLLKAWEKRKKRPPIPA